MLINAFDNIVRLRNINDKTPDGYAVPGKFNCASLEPLKHDTINFSRIKDRNLAMRDYKKELSIMLDGIEEPEYDDIKKKEIPETFDEYARVEVDYFDKKGVLRRKDSYYDDELYVTLYSENKNMRYEAKMLIKSPDEDDGKWHYKCIKNWYNPESPKRVSTHSEVLKLDKKHGLIDRQVFYID